MQNDRPPLFRRPVPITIARHGHDALHFLTTPPTTIPLFD
ncbi:hypothetical protein RISK_003741 [Rhodopirellula islandica]|uniref:Uncharacterized protein n=1 Tax=Rhodopirellula islandica TaxID=595434 RepID=A0A0J1BBY0_RHOIS|nr:hypothetical protein RISK_003741 [Rhodopirellula islandica]